MFNTLNMEYWSNCFCSMKKHFSRYLQLSDFTQVILKLLCLKTWFLDYPKYSPSNLVNSCS